MIFQEGTTFFFSFFCSRHVALDRQAFMLYLAISLNFKFPFSFCCRLKQRIGYLLVIILESSNSNEFISIPIHLPLILCIIAYLCKLRILFFIRAMQISVTLFNSTVTYLFHFAESSHYRAVFPSTIYSSIELYWFDRNLILV